MASAAPPPPQYAQLVDLLVAGGYFRARLPGLRPFDVVVGGLVWSLTAIGGLEEGGDGSEAGASFYTSGGSYSELNVGTRLRMAEVLEASLLSLPSKGLGKMHPSVIRAHQITGLDFDNLLPAFRWLIRKVMEVRAESGDAPLRIAKHTYRTSYAAAEQDATAAAAVAVAAAAADKTGARDDANASVSPAKLGAAAVHDEERMAKYCRDIERSLRHGRFRVKRRMRRRKGADAEHGDGSIETNLQGVLLEYGHYINTFNHTVDDKKSGGPRSADGGKGDDGGVRLREGMESMSSSVSSTLSGSAARKIVSLRRDELQEAAARYEDDSSGDSVGNAATNHRKQVEMIQRQIGAQRMQLATVESKLESVRQSLEEAEAQRDVAEEGWNSLKATHDKLLEAVHGAGTPEEIESLMALGTENRRLLAEDNEKRTEYQRKLEAMEAQIQSGSLRELDPDEEEEINNLDTLIGAEEKKRDKIRSGLAKVGREVAFFRRKVEDTPTQPELLQYNRRFTELYEQVLSTLEENRRYYAAYNTLVEQQKFVTKEISLQNSIKTQYDEASKTADGRRAILESLGEIAKGVKATVEQYNKKLDQQESSVCKLRERMSQLNAQKRQYLSAIQELQVEFNRAAV